VTLHEAALQVGQGLDHVQHQLYAYAARARLVHHECVRACA
jgi:hypothetical protein